MHLKSTQPGGDLTGGLGVPSLAALYFWKSTASRLT
jgi:hypothetical protein